VLPECSDPPGPYSPNDPVDGEFFTSINTLLKDYTDAMDAVKLRLGLQTIMLISIRGNNYLQSSGLNKALLERDAARCAQVVSRAINLIYVLSALVYPFMPATAESILTQLNAPPRAVPEGGFACDVLGGHVLGRPEHLFKRIDEKMAEVWRAKFGGIESAEDKPKGSTSKPSKANASGTVKTAEYLEIEEKVSKQGQVVRELKLRQPRTNEVEGEIAAAVTELKRLKGLLEVM
jgi:methionyl-tRNA synthetase